MQLQKFIFFLFLLSIQLLNAQIFSNYNRGFENGFKEGYCYYSKTVDCLVPLTPIIPTPRINEKSDSYNDGYNRGFTFGQNLKRNKTEMDGSDDKLNEIPKFNNYVSQNPVEMMRIVGMYKQQKYDARTQWTQDRINQLQALSASLFNYDYIKYFDANDLRTAITSQLKKLMNSTSSYDYADDYQFNTIRNGLNDIENLIYENFNQSIKFMNEIEEKNKSKNSANQPVVQNNQPKNTSELLSINSGTYSCEITEFELNAQEKYTITKTSIGMIELSDDKLKYGTTDLNKYRILSDATVDNKNQKAIYKTDHGDVSVDFDFSKIIFYNTDYKNYYIYKILNKK